MEIYEFTDYKEFVLDTLQSFPKKGHGQLSKIAASIGVNSSLLSHVFNGDRHLTEDQAYGVAKYLGLGTKETLFFLLLVQKDKAGLHELKKIFEAQIKTLQNDSKLLKNRITPDKELTPEQQSIYYSNWIFTAVYALTSIENLGTIHALSDHLHLSPSIIRGVVDTLIRQGICVEKNGRILAGPKSTYIAGDSPHANRHHANWRVQGLGKMTEYKEDHFFYTVPFSISKSDYQTIRSDLIKLIERLNKRIAATDPVETAACLNIDFFKI